MKTIIGGGGGTWTRVLKKLKRKPLHA